MDLPRSKAVSQWLYNKEESMNTVLWIVQVPLLAWKSRTSSRNVPNRQLLSILFRSELIHCVA